MLVSCVPTGWIQHPFEGNAFSERSTIRVYLNINDQISTKIQTCRQGKCKLYFLHIPQSHNYTYSYLFLSFSLLKLLLVSTQKYGI
jgi:hypothetical protein